MIANSNLANLDEDVEQYVIAVDFGAKYIRVCAALVYLDEIKIIGYGQHKSEGFSENGIKCMNKLKESLSTAYNSADRAVRSTYNKDTLPFIDNPRIFVAIPGRYIEYKNNDGSCEIGHRAITSEHMVKAFNNACSLSIEGKELITSFNNYYQVDSNNFIDDPRSLVGGQLKSHAHLLYADKDFLTNIKYVVSSCIRSKYMYEFIYAGVASSHAVLTDLEKKLGVCVLDIGAGSVDITVYENGYQYYSGISSLAGQYVTRSLAVAYGLNDFWAEKIKCESQEISEDKRGDTIEINGNENIRSKISFPKKDFLELLDADYGLVFKKAIESVEIKGLELGAGFVLTGGGAKYPGALNKLSEIIANYGAERLASKVKIGQIDEQLTGLTDAIDPYSDTVLIGLLKLSREIQTKRYIPPSKSKVKNMLNSLLSALQQEM